MLGPAPLPLVIDHEDLAPAGVNRSAAAITLAGAALTAVAALLPSGEAATFGFSLATMAGQNQRFVLAALAAVSAGIAATVLFRRPATRSLAILLIGLAVAQLAIGIWVGADTVNEMRRDYPHLVLISAIGTGVYAAMLGSACTLVGALVAWRKRRLE